MKRKIIFFLSLSVTVATCFILFGISQDRSIRTVDDSVPQTILTQGFYDPIQQLSDVGAKAFWPAIAINNRGDIMVVFTQETSGDAGLYYTISQDSGDTWSTPKKTFSWKENIKSCDLAADPDGNFHLAYSDGITSGSRQIYYRHYANGQWGPIEQLSSINQNSNWCNIAVDGDEVHVVWYQELGWPTRPVTHLTSKKIGGPWSDPQEDVFKDPVNGFMYPDIKASNGNLYIVSQRQNYTGDTLTSKEIVFRERRQGIWRPTFTVGAHAWPDIEVDSRNGIHCIYPEFGKVRYRARTDESNWQKETSINTLKGVDGFFDLDFRNNTLIAVFLQAASRNPEHWSVYFRVRKFDKGWGGWETIIETDMGGYADLPRAVIDSDGYAHIVWVDWHTQDIREADTIWYNKWEVAKPDVPTLDLSNYSLSFEAPQGEIAETQSLQVRNAGPGTLNYKISTDDDWITVTPASGTCGNDWVDHWVDVNTNLEEGTHTGTITFTSAKAENSPLTANVSLKVLAPPIYEPLNFKVEKKENYSYFFRELIHLLKWEPNPLNKDITKYLITCEYEENSENITRVFEISGNTYEYANRKIISDTEYTYSIQAVDDKNRVGPPAIFTIK
ncbi:hypothetical protein AMJ44_03295 [candidate division WOR-1 bacterium DG_54_3]|uniref:Fibronectin type-III domain-containing protein n=1 Tax=candidate division WOR-1 bacterium DG_54_3 TaxID=1703775 RepID=A0A0S7Y641_UNCSA|nr:MAG: hypothetical protein AMJ44_03295 [candidate division WOR-1 bacterium DG_54_3]